MFRIFEGQDLGPGFRVCRVSSFGLVTELRGIGCMVKRFDGFCPFVVAPFLHGCRGFRVFGAGVHNPEDHYDHRTLKTLRFKNKAFLRRYRTLQ